MVNPETASVVSLFLFLRSAVVLTITLCLLQSNSLSQRPCIQLFVFSEPAGNLETSSSFLRTHPAHILENLHLTNLSRQRPGNKTKLDATFVDFLSEFRVLKRVCLDHTTFIENRSIPTFKQTRLYPIRWRVECKCLDKTSKYISVHSTITFERQFSRQNLSS